MSGSENEVTHYNREATGSRLALRFHPFPQATFTGHPAI